MIRGNLSTSLGLGISAQLPRRMYQLSTAAFTFLLPFEHLWNLIFGEKTIFKPYRLAGLAMLAFTVGRALGLGRRALRVDTFDLHLIALFSWGFGLALLWHVVEGASIEKTFPELTLIVFGLGLHIAVKNACDTHADLKMWLNAYVVGSVLALLLGYGTSSGRLTGLYKNPNSLGTNAGLVTLFCLASLWFSPKKQGVWLTAAYSTLAALGVVFVLKSGSRGALISTAAATVILVLKLPKRRVFSVKNLVRAAAALAAIGAFTPILKAELLNERSDQVALSRYDLEAVKEMSGRAEIWHSAWVMSKKYHFIGAGISGYRSRYHDALAGIGISVSSYTRGNGLGTHSDFVSVLVNYGLVGVVIFLSFVFHLGLRLVRRLQCSDRLDRITAFGAVAPFVVVFQQLATNSFLSPGYYFFLAFGILATRAAPRSDKQSTTIFS